ncbi:Hpt domain-containing protein [Lachnospiraceae bacterium]|nr:Hpt domain-containing protein [Lachnospiraceae bacterium]
MITIDALKSFGVDTDEGLTRCMNNEALYLRLVSTVAGEPSFDKLSDAIEAGDLDAAFEAAHALKGVLGNLSITPMYEKAAEITELLRAREDIDYKPLIQDLLQKRDVLGAM